MTADPLKCRAQVHDACYDGSTNTKVVYGGESWRTDGTYLAESQSVVCDACYIALGTPNNGPELEGAIAARKARA